MEEKIVDDIKDKVSMLVSLSRILENIYNTSSDISEADMWALIVTIKDNSQELLEYLNTAAPDGKISLAS